MYSHALRVIVVVIITSFVKQRNFHFDAKGDCMCEYCNELSDQ
jgi:hypothetical protein